MARISRNKHPIPDRVGLCNPLSDYGRAHNKATVSTFLDPENTDGTPRTDVDRPPLRLVYYRERERCHDLRCALYDPLRVRLGHVHPARLAVHEIRVLRELDVEPYHVALAGDVHERAVVRLDDGPIPYVWEVRLRDDVDYAPDGVCGDGYVKRVAHTGGYAEAC